MNKYTFRQLDRTNNKDYLIWKNGLENFNGATIFHDPDFLAYHGNRFHEHHLGVYKGEELFGLIPLAFIEVENKKIAKSPYGASYGSFIFKDLLSYSDSKRIVESFIHYLTSLSIHTIILTPSLNCYHYSSSDTFSFALLEKGFKCINSDITSIVSLTSDHIETEIFTSRARNMVRKAQKENIFLKANCTIDDFWILMDKTFSKHGVPSTHSKDELNNLHKRFPEQIYFNIAYLNQTPIAGIAIFKLNTLINMSFYLCSDPEFQEKQGLSLIVANAITSSKMQGSHYFDFGTSSVNMVGRENIFRFKESFGAIGKFRNTYQLDLR
jgi:hypothetical protein